MINFLLNLRCLFYTIFDRFIFDNRPTSMNKPGWKLTFYDDFSSGLDKNKWRTDTYWGGRYSTDSIKNDNKAPISYMKDDAFKIIQNKFSIENRKETTIIHHIDSGIDYGTFSIPYVTGGIDSSISFQQKYGYFEIRSKTPNTPGTWPAFWLASTEAWPPEIDIYENYTGTFKGDNSFNSNVHYGIANTKTKGDYCTTHWVPKPSDDFHVYATEWDVDYIKFYFDGVLIKVIKDKKILKWFNHKMHIIIGNGIDINTVDKCLFPNYLTIDYVKAYKKIIS